MKNYKLTLIGLSISLVVYLSTIISGIDLFERLIVIMEDFEDYEIDEFFIPIGIFFVFALFDRQKAHEFQIEFEKIKVYKAMMSSTHHVLNNFLNQMQLFKLEAEDTPEFDPEILNLYGQIIEEASLQIDALGSITKVNDISIRSSVKPKV